jgi:hypothetical protein
MAQAVDDASEGPLVGLPHALSVDGGTPGPNGALTRSALYVHRIGFTATAPAELVPSGAQPDYRTSAILQGIAPAPDVDAFSAGLDWVLSDGDGVVAVPPGHWGALTLSVSRSTVGVAGGVVAHEVARPDGAAGDVFSYVLPGSTFPPELVDRTMRAQDSTEISIGHPVADPDLDAHDIMTALLWIENPAIAVLLPAEQAIPRAYFSVTSGTVGLVPLAWWGGSAPSGATVLTSRWDATARTWSVPAPFLTHADLGLAAGEELDALAVDIVRHEMLFSTKSPLLDQVLWASFATDAVAVRVYRTPHEPVSMRLTLLRTDDVDAICALDPGGSTLMQMLMGTSQQVFPVPTTLSASVFRTETLTSVQLVSNAAGWPPSGRGQGVLGCVLALGIPSPPWFSITLQARNPTTPVGGDPREGRARVPAAAVLSGLPVIFDWLAVDQALTSIGTSHGVRAIL